MEQDMLVLFNQHALLLISLLFGLDQALTLGFRISDFEGWKTLPLPSGKDKRFHKDHFTGGWRDGSAIRSTCCSCRTPGSDSQHLHGGSQPPITPVPDSLMSSSDLQQHKELT